MGYTGFSAKKNLAPLPAREAGERWGLARRKAGLVMGTSLG